MTITETTDRLTEDQQAYIDGLRDLADYLAAHPDLIPDGGSYGTTFYRWIGAGGDATASDDVKATFANLARQLGSAEKQADESWFNLNRQFGPHTFQITARRHDVCERVVVGTETVTVEEPDPEQVAALPKLTRTEEREVVRWECPPSILAAGSQS